LSGGSAQKAEERRRKKREVKESKIGRKDWKKH
jgi:hypothetical protein